MTGVAGSIYNWSVTPATNATADSGINWQENQQPDTVNNSARQEMARVAEFVADITPTRVSAGSGTIYTVTAQSTPSTLPDGYVITFYVDRNNTGPCSLSINGTTTIPLRAKSGVELVQNEMLAGTVVAAYYRLATAELLITNSGLFVNQLAPSLISAKAFGLRVGDAIISLNTTPNPGFVRLTESTQALLKASYPDLDAWASGLGYPWGSASTTFNLPPAAGYALRFAATSNAIDPDGPRILGSTQVDAIKQHTHGVGTLDMSTTGAHTHNVTAVRNVGGGVGSGGSIVAGLDTFATTSAGDHKHTLSGSTDSGSGTIAAETRMKNVAFALDILASPALVANGLIGTVGYSYKYSTTTTDADPGAGFFRLNNASMSSATLLYISATDAVGAAMASPLVAWGNSTSSVKGRLRIVKIGAPANYIEFDITAALTSATTYYKANLTLRASSGSFSDADPCHVLFIPKGDKGDTGAVGGGTGADLNLVVNGAFQINQRVFAGGALTAGNYGYDRWKADTGGANVTVSGYSVTLTSGTIKQVIEPALFGLSSFASTTFTLSVQTLTGGNLSVAFGTATGTITAAAGVCSVSLSTGAGDTGNLNLKIGVSSGTPVFTRVKLEVGSPATAWVSRNRVDELALCRRYWQKSFPYATAPAGNTGAAGVVYMQALAAGIYTHQQSVPLAAPMRQAPVVTFYNPSASNNQCRNLSAGADCANTQVASGTPSEDRFGVYTETPAGTAVAHSLLFHWAADAEL